MGRFRYSALTDAGDLITGDLAADDAEFVLARLRSQSLLPIDTREVTPRAGLRPSLWPRKPVRLPTRDLALACQQLARLLKAGVPLERALGILVDLVEGRRITGVLKQTLDRVRDGAALAEALTDQGESVPGSFVTLVRAGELSGALPGVLSETAAFMLRADAMRQKVISAMIYPLILVVAASLSVALILTVVLPQFEPMFRDAGASLPLSTRLVVVAGHTLRGGWWGILLFIGSASVAAHLALRSPAVRLERDRFLLSAPIVGSLIGRYEIVRFCRTLGVMLSSGVAAQSALALSGSAIRNRVLASAVDEAAARFKEGEGLSGPLARSQRFPALAIQLIRIGEETGRLDEMLNEVAAIFDQEVQRALDRLLTLLVPVLTLTMGLGVAFIVAAVMMALMSVNALAL